MALDLRQSAIKVSNDPRKFLRATFKLLRQDPLHNIPILTLVQDYIHAPRPSADHLFLTVQDTAADIVGVALRCQHGRWLLGLLSEDLVPTVARAISQLDPGVRTLDGPLITVKSVAKEIAAQIGHQFCRSGGHLLHTTGSLFPAAAIGAARPATTDDAAICRQWLPRLSAELPDAPGAEAIARISRSEISITWLWEVEGKAVSLVQHRIDLFGVTWVGPAYTLPQHRRHGYAMALMSHVTEDVLARGSIPCLHTHLISPDLARACAALGYHPIAEHAVFDRRHDG
jgi:GNAT superfamily N-acetyltransferase